MFIMFSPSRRTLKPAPHESPSRQPLKLYSHETSPSTTLNTLNFARAREAVRRLATNDKVKYFGNLIRNGYLSGEHIENSEFEEYLDILNTMSYREIQYLVDYKKYCDEKNKGKKYNIVIDGLILKESMQKYVKFQKGNYGVSLLELKELDLLKKNMKQKAEMLMRMIIHLIL